MAGGISIHVYDVSRGVPAAGLRVELRGPDGKLLVDAQTAKPGTLDGPTPLTGTYEALFHIGDWYRAQGIAVPSHLPLKMTPWGFSLFRGGA
jgi:5-hydroxyisourate hydrolase